MGNHPYEKLTKTRLSEQIAGRLESLILSNELRPGDKLPAEKELAERFGVSRAAARESIKLLEERKLVESRAGLGAFVTSPGMANVTSSLHVAYRLQDCSYQQLHEARWHLESLVTRLAAERATAKDVATMEEALARMDATVDDPPSFLPADMEFHTALAAATQNPLFVVMTRPLIDMLQYVSAASLPAGGRSERHQYHRRLLDCIKNKDATGAVDAIQRQLDLSRCAMEKAMGAGQPIADSVQDSPQ
ncbi:MAG: FadR family transcriptional regulator [Chloroflexi bacterium]|nr:FadR family transcriptional regulator [Chloroflexota bacterium]